MAYYEMTAHPKGVLMMGNDGLRAPYSNNGTGPGSFLPMNIPVFSHPKSLPSAAMPPPLTAGSAAEVTRRGMPSFVASQMTLNGTHPPIANGGSGNLNMVPLQISGDFGPAAVPQADESAEKGKRSSKGDGNRISRGGGTTSRKRTRAAQADSLTTSEVMPDISLSSGAEPVGARTTPNGIRVPENYNGDKSEKSAGRRHSGQGAKRGDKKQSPAVAPSANEALTQKPVEANVPPVEPASGILELYGLQTRALDVSRLMVDISLDDLLSENYEVPSFTLAENRETKVEVGDVPERRNDHVLSTIFSCVSVSKFPYTKLGELPGGINSKSFKKDKAAMLDLERPVQLEKEDGALKAGGNADKEMQIEVASASNAEGNVNKDAAVHPVSRSTGQAPHSRFSIESLPLHSVESFDRIMKLPPCDPLPSLIARIGRGDGEASGSADDRAGGDVVDSCHRNGSIPPSPFSYPHVGPVKLENARNFNRTWIRHPPVGQNGVKMANRLSEKGGSNAVEEDGSASPSSRKRKLDTNRDTMQSSEAAPPSTSGADQPALPSARDQIVSHVEMPRQVENALGTSTEGTVAPMQVDSAPTIGVSGEHVRGATEGETGGLRPTEVSAALQHTSDSQSKAGTGEQKQDYGESQEAVKDEGKLEGNTVPVSSSRPAADVGSSVGISSASHNEASAGPHSPTVEEAARTLCMISGASWTPIEERFVREKEKRRRAFPSSPGAPVQRAPKSIRVSSSGGGHTVDGAVAGGGKDGSRRNANGASVPHGSRSLLSERRKSLSQVNEATAKPSHTSPRTAGTTGASISSRGSSHTGARSSHSAKLDKVKARESAKDTSGAKEASAKGTAVASAPPASHGAAPLKNSHKGVKTNSHVHPNNNSSKNGAAAANFTKAPTAGPPQRVPSGGASVRGSRSVHHNANGLVSHAQNQTTSPPFKSSRQSSADSRQKTKSELSGRGGKSNRE